MFGLSTSRPKSPVEPEMREWIDYRWDWLTKEFGKDWLRNVQVIFPTSEFFPDVYRRTHDDAKGILQRVCGYMKIDPASVDCSFYDLSEPKRENWRWFNAAGLYEKKGDRFHIRIEESNLRDPLALVAVIAHELGHVHLLGHGRISPDEQDQEPLTDLLTVFMGLGLFNANAVIRSKSWSEGQMSLFQIHRLGYLDMSIFGYAFAKFAIAREETNPIWTKKLRPDVRKAYNQAIRYLTECDELEPNPVSRSGFGKKKERTWFDPQELQSVQQEVGTSDTDSQLEVAATCRFCKNSFQINPAEDAEEFELEHLAEDPSGAWIGICPACLMAVKENQLDLELMRKGELRKDGIIDRLVKKYWKQFWIFLAIISVSSIIIMVIFDL